MPGLERACVCVVVGGLLSSTLAAADLRYPHVVRVPDAVAAPARPSAPPAPAKPTVDAETVLSIDALAQPVRADQEPIVVALIAQTPDSNKDEKADLYFRLGTMYAQQQRFWRLKAIAATTPKDVATASNRAKDYLLKSVKVFKSLVDNDAFLAYPKRDIALFYYGYTLQGGKYMKEARAVYDNLLKNFPNSIYVPEAHLVFGEYFFDNNQLADAEARYKMVLKFPKARAYWYAMYKVGWIDLALQRHQEALETFFQVAQATKADRAAEALHRAAVHDFVRAYAEIGKADKAAAAFQRVDAKAVDDMVAALVELYVATGKPEQAAVLYRDMVHRQPTSPQVCAWQAAIARASADDVEVENLAKLWQAWSTRPASADTKRCHDDALAIIGARARVVHREAAATPAIATFERADRLYTGYLAAFPDAPDRAEVAYFRAEAQWGAAETEANPRLRAGRWTSAAAAFADVPETDRALKHDAAVASVAAWKTALGLDPSFAVLAGRIDVASAARARTPAAEPVTPLEVKMLEGFDAAAAFVDADELGRMKLVTAIIHRRHHRLDEALGFLLELAKLHDADTFAVAANLALESLVLANRTGEARALADELHATAGLLDGRADLARSVDYVRAH